MDVDDMKRAESKIREITPFNQSRSLIAYHGQAMNGVGEVANHVTGKIQKGQRIAEVNGLVGLSHPGTTDEIEAGLESLREMFNTYGAATIAHTLAAAGHFALGAVDMLDGSLPSTIEALHDSRDYPTFPEVAGQLSYFGIATDETPSDDTAFKLRDMMAVTLWVFGRKAPEAIHVDPIGTLNGLDADDMRTLLYGGTSYMDGPDRIMKGRKAE